jgi:hypothetical protein
MEGINWGHPVNCMVTHQVPFSNKCEFACVTHKRARSQVGAVSVDVNLVIQQLAFPGKLRRASLCPALQTRLSFLVLWRLVYQDPDGS